MAKSGQKREPVVAYIKLKPHQVARFWSNYESKDHAECWDWIGTTIDGYGRFVVNKSSRLAHRVSWMVYRGPIPEGAQINHKCNNRRCVNPSHLYAGTAADNTADAVKARTAKIRRGAENNTSKLTAEQVLGIREELAGGASTRALGRKYGVSNMAISMINTRKNWGWL